MLLRGSQQAWERTWVPRHGGKAHPETDRLLDQTSALGPQLKHLYSSGLPSAGADWDNDPGWAFYTMPGHHHPINTNHKESKVELTLNAWIYLLGALSPQCYGVVWLLA